MWDRAGLPPAQKALGKTPLPGQFRQRAYPGLRLQYRPFGPVYGSQAGTLLSRVSRKERHHEPICQPPESPA